jgi:hypothetical protein
VDEDGVKGWALPLAPSDLSSTHISVGIPLSVSGAEEELVSRGALQVVGAAPALAEDTAGIEPAGEAERATTAKSEALAPWTQGETRHEVEMHERESRSSRRCHTRAGTNTT